MADLPGYISDTELYYESGAEIPTNDASPCCGDNVDSGGGATTPGDTLGENPNEPLREWISRCTGGGEVDQAADETDAEAETARNFQPILTLTIPGEATSRRYASRAMAGAHKTRGTVLEVRGVRRGVSDDQGSPLKATASVLVSDDDGSLRTAIGADPVGFTANAQALIALTSESGHAAGITPRSLLRARMDTPTYEIRKSGDQRTRAVRLNLIDALAPYYDTQLNSVVFERADFPDINRALEGTPIPLIGGEHSDAGAQDVNGNSAEKGLVPLIYVGTYQTINDDPLSGAAAFLAPPENVAASPDAGTGSRSYFYGVTALSENGETVLSTAVEVSTGPTVLTATDSITVTWDAVTDAVDYIVYGRNNVTPVRRLKQVGNVLTYTDTGADPEHAPAPPNVNTAQTEDADGGFRWDLYVVCLGVVNVQELYGSNDAKGEAPKRIALHETAGVDFLIPGYAGWPHAQPYVEIGGKRLTVIYGRGPRSQAHKDGNVTLVISTCGYEDAGDGSGDSIQQFFPLVQHFLTQFVPMDGLPVYMTGSWGALREFADGVKVLQTSQFAACQALTADFLGDDVGYRGAIYLREPITVREFIQIAATTAECGFATNHHGQWYPTLVNPLALPTAGTHYRERIEILELLPPELDTSAVEPFVQARYDYDPDAGKMRSEVETFEDEDAVEAQPGLTEDRPVRELRYTRDALTARNAMRRRVQRLKYPRWKQPFIAKYRPGLALEPGAQFRLSHPDGPLSVSGWVNRPFTLTEHEIVGDRIRCAGYDIYDLLTEGNLELRRTVLSLSNSQLKTPGEYPFDMTVSSTTRAKFIGSTVRVDASNGAYTNINASGYFNISVAGEPFPVSEYLENNASPALTYFSDLLGSAAHSFYDIGPYKVDTATGAGIAPGPVTVRGDVVGVPLVLVINNGGSGPLTGGHALNSGEVALYWIKEPV